MIPTSTHPKFRQSVGLNTSLQAMVLFHAQRGQDDTLTDFRLGMLNSTAQQYWGRSQAELIGKLVSQLFEESNSRFLLQQFRLVVETGRAVRFDMNFQFTENATVDHYDVLVSKLEDGVVINFGLLTHSSAPIQDQTATKPAPTTKSDFSETPTPLPALVQDLYKRPISRLMGLIIIGIALSSLAGWGFDMPALYSFGIPYTATVVHTALMLLLIGFRLFIVNLKGLLYPTALGKILLGLLFAISIPAVLTFLVPQSYATGIDQALGFQNYTNDLPVAFGRPALITSICFIILGVAFVLIRRERSRMIGQFLALSCSLLAFITMLGHVAHIKAFYTFGTYSAIAIPTALAIALAGIGILNLYPRQGLMQAVTSIKVGGMTIRYVGVYLMLVPSLLVVLFLKLLDNQIARPDFLMLILLSGFIISSFFFLYWIAQHLNALDNKAVQQYKQLQATERELRNQYELLTGIQNAIQTPLSALRAVRRADGSIEDFEFVFKTDAAYSLTNHPADKVIGSRMLDVFPHTRETGMLDRYITIVETNEAQVFEQQYQADGVNGWFEIRAFPWGDGIVVSANNITELRRAERERLKQADFTEKVLNGITNGVLLGTAVRDTQGKIIDILIRRVNQECAKQFGRTVAETEGQQLGIIFPGIYQAGLFDMYARTIETGQFQSIEIYYGQDGIDSWGVVQTQPADDDGLVITWIDVSDQKRAAKAIEQQRALLQTVVDNMQQAGMMLGEPVRNAEGQITDFRYLMTNQFNARVMGMEVQNMTGNLMGQLMPGWQELEQFKKFVEVVETGQERQYLFQFEGYGFKGWFDCFASCIDGCLLYTYTDVTAIKEAELQAQRQSEQLEVANYELKRSNESLQSFAYIASHDLQEPLRKITAFADVLHTEYADQFDSTASDIIRRMHDAAARMRTLIQDLLAYSRVETQHEMFGPVDLAELIEELREDELWVAFQKSKAELRLVDRPVVSADPSQMRQLFQNLLSNAIKFCAKDTIPQITITHRVVNRSEIPTQLLSPAQQTAGKPVTKQFHELAVSDNGIGFEQKYAERVFEVFQRLNNKLTYSGSGIGLAICKKIMERHNGAITVNSELEKGTIFRLYLPA